MNFESVRSIIDTYIKKNGVEAITGDILNNVLNTMLDDVDTAISSIEPSPGGGSGEGGVSEKDVLNILEKNNYITSSALFSYYTKTESDNRYLASSLLGSNTLIHSGNIGSYKAGDSALFDGRTSGEYYLSQKNGIPNGDLANLAAGSYYAASAKGDINPLPIDYCSLSVLGQSYYSQQLCMYHNATRAWLRGIYNTSSGVSATEWHELAFLDSNVASAKSLVASNGTTYVSYNSTYGQVNVNGINIGYGGNTIECATSSKLYIQKNVTQDTILNMYGGNVGIGTDSPSYKLDVNGDISAMSALRIGGCGASYCGLYPNSQITSNGQNSKLWLYNDYGLVLYGTSLEILTSTSITGNLIVSGDVASA